MSGRKPYGRNEQEIAVIARMRRLRNVHHGKRKSWCEIANLLNEQQVPPPAGKRWYGTSIKNILEHEQAAPVTKIGRTKSGIEPNDYLTMKQIGALLRLLTAEAKEVEKTGAVTAIHRRTMIITLLESGVRNAELCDLRIEDLPVWHQKEQIRVRCGKGRKGRNVHISQNLREMLDNYCRRFRDCAKPNDYVFKNRDGGRLSPASLRHIVKGAGRRAGIPDLHPHEARHTLATHLANRTKDTKFVGRQLGHSNPATTDIYVGVINKTWAGYMMDYSEELRAAEVG